MPKEDRDLYDGYEITSGIIATVSIIKADLYWASAAVPLMMMDLLWQKGETIHKKCDKHTHHPRCFEDQIIS